MAVARGFYSSLWLELNHICIRLLAAIVAASFILTIGQNIWNVNVQAVAAAAVEVAAAAATAVGAASVAAAVLLLTHKE